MSNAPISTASALQILRDASDKSYTSAAKTDLAGLGNLLGAKTAQVSATVKQTHGEQMDSLTKFSAGLAGLGLNAKTSLLANKPLPPMREQKDAADAAFLARQRSKAEGHRAALNAASQGGQISQLVDKAHDAVSQSVGGQSLVHKAQIEAKSADLDETVAKTMQEGGKDAKQAAAKAQDGVTELARTLYDRAKQVADKIFG